VILAQDALRSTFLPHVWEEIPRKEEFLSKLCLKGGMPAGCWRDRGTGVQTYEAVVFGEH